jgi:2-phosphosulfolactate phosphatase
MKFHYTDLETCHTVTGLVVVIDVIRAFTNAAFAFSRGAKEIHPVSTVEEALQLRTQISNSLVCGEVGGIPPDGFDFGNSPTQTKKLDLSGRILIQRTSRGTQGIVRSSHASAILASSFVIAKATANYILQVAPESVSFVNTGQREDHSGDEDLACAEYLEALLRGDQPHPALYIDRVYQSRAGIFDLDPDFPAFPKSDLDHCSQVDMFDFAMPVTKENGRYVMRAVKCT